MMLPQMIFLGMVVTAFVAFMVTLAYGSLTVWLWERSRRRASSAQMTPARTLKPSASPERAQAPVRGAKASRELSLEEV